MRRETRLGSRHGQLAIPLETPEYYKMRQQQMMAEAKAKGREARYKFGQAWRELTHKEKPSKEGVKEKAKKALKNVKGDKPAKEKKKISLEKVRASAIAKGPKAPKASAAPSGGGASGGGGGGGGGGPVKTRAKGKAPAAAKEKWERGSEQKGPRGGRYYMSRNGTKVYMSSRGGK